MTTPFSIEPQDAMLLIGGASQAEAMEVWQSTLQGNGHIVHKHVAEGFAYSKECMEALVSIISAHRPTLLILLHQEEGRVSDHIRLAAQEAIKMGASSARIVSVPEICAHAALEGAAASGSKSGLLDEAIALDVMEQAEWAPLLADRRAQGHPGLPLVSVLIRSMDRPELREALDSVALQTWPNIEVCVVNATGAEHSRLPEEVAGLAVRLLSGGNRLDRSAAANMGLEGARGEFLIFLDDDDVLFPTHLERLCAALMSDETGRRVAYAGVELVDEGGNRIRVLDEVWDARRLRGANYIPIHALMFAGDLVRKNGFAFDTRLSCLEDWDFWLQLSTATDFVHVPGVSALYRFALGQSALSGAADQSRYLESRRMIFEKWNNLYPADAWVETFVWFENALSYFHEQTILQLRAAGEQEFLKNDALARNAALEEEIAQLRDDLSAVRLRLDQTEMRSDQVRAELTEERRRIAAILNSTSWKVSRPIRVVKRLMRGERQAVIEQLRQRVQAMARTLYRRLPPRVSVRAKNIAYRVAGGVFKGMPSYEIWRRSPGGRSAGHPGSVSSAQLVDISDVEPIHMGVPGSVAIHLHLYYQELALEFRTYFNAVPFPFDLFVSVASPAGVAEARRVFGDMAMLRDLHVEVFPNQGRDIGPMVAGFGERLKKYDYVAHVHSKKSLYNRGATDGWRHYLCESLFGDALNVRRIFRLLERHGMVYPQMFWMLPYSACTWLGNASVGRQLFARLGLRLPSTTYFDFPVGSMFWAKGALLAPLLNAEIGFDDFPLESGQTDGTLAHAVERTFGCLHERSGLGRPAVIKDNENRSWSAWRVDQYVSRSRQSILQQVADPSAQVLIFDIFDTLLTRPFCDAEQVKHIVAQRIGEIGPTYLQLRAEAESRARAVSATDVGLDVIYQQLGAMAGWSAQQVCEVLRIECDVELGSIQAREDGVFLFNQALKTGKRVVLASDMYLARQTIEQMLRASGVAGWHALYVSSEVGVRKDSGLMFARICSDEGVPISSLLVLGDNEQSDVHLPWSLGAKAVHLMRHSDLAQALPRLASLMTRPELRSDPNWSFSMGLITRRLFAPVFVDDFDPSAMYGRTDPFVIGYGMLGPVVLSFVQWLVTKASQEAYSRIWFLAREGQFLQEVYEAYVASLKDAPASAYLCVSRRTVSVPAISAWEDIERIATDYFGPADIAMLLDARYGITLDEAASRLLRESGAPSAGDLVMVRGGDPGAVIPTLKCLEHRIRARAQEELDPLLAYLEEIGWARGERQVVVDVGYSGSIQYYLNAMLGQPVSGFYMLTNTRAEGLRDRFGVESAGCFHEGVALAGDQPVMYSQSFMLEKLLSSDDPQVVRYELDEYGRAHPVFKSLSEAEISARALRREIRSAAMTYVREFISESARMGVSLQCPVDLSRTLYEIFAEGASQAELHLLSGLSLDDHYCGRGVVS